MTTRTTKSMVTFTRPFNLTGFDGEQPAGSYSVETDEELLEGVSFPAYRRMATMMQVDASSRVRPACCKSQSSIRTSLRRPWRLTLLTIRTAMSSPHGAP